MSSTRQQLSEKERVARDVFTRLAAEADRFEGYAHPHAARVAAIAEALAERFGLGREDCANLRIAALAHDLGELAMKRDYIKRDGPLSDEERLDLARHPVIGEQEAARSGADRGAQLLVRWHHEWWDGAGYPDALRGEQIPLPARILRAADAYSALTDDRPFRRALTEEAARKHITEWAGLEFDPGVARALLALTDLPELRSYARRDESETQDRARESAQVGRGVGRAEAGRETDREVARAEAAREVGRGGVDRSEVDREQASGAGESPASVVGAGESGVDEWGVPRR